MTFLLFWGVVWWSPSVAGTGAWFCWTINRLEHGIVDRIQIITFVARLSVCLSACVIVFSSSKCNALIHCLRSSRAVCVCFRYLELESSGRRDEVRFHYTHDQQARVETFPYRLADGRWHRVAFTLSGSRVTLSVNCSQIYSRVIRESVDKTFSADKQQLKLFIGQRNDQHALFRVSIVSVTIEFQMQKFKVRWKSKACPLLKKPWAYSITACFAWFACCQQFCVCNFCISGSFDRISPHFSYNIFLFVYYTERCRQRKRWRSFLKGSKGATVNQTSIGTISKLTLRKLLEDMVERIWVFLSA